MIKRLEKLALVFKHQRRLEEGIDQLISIPLHLMEEVFSNVVVVDDLLLETKSKIEALIQQQYLGSVVMRILDDPFQTALQFLLDSLFQVHDDFAGQHALDYLLHAVQFHIFKGDLLVGSCGDLDDLLPLVADEGSYVLETFSDCLLEDGVLTGVGYVAREQDDELVVGEAG
jgi:hypothetical protein